MQEMRKWLAAGGLLMLALLPLLYLFVTLEAYKTSADFAFYADAYGEREYLAPGEDAGRLLAIHTSLSKRIIESRGDEAKMEFVVDSTDLATGRRIFYSREVLDYNMATSRLTKNGNVYNWLPKSMERRDYEDIYYSSALPVSDYRFGRVEYVGGLETYVFSFGGAMDAAGRYPDYPGVRISREMEGEIWVEPKSGRVVDVRAAWVAYVQSPDGPVEIDRGWTRYSPDTRLALLEEAMEGRSYVEFAELWFPFMVILAALGLFAAAYLAEAGKYGKG
jgi:hypothetical protein